MDNFEAALSDDFTDTDDTETLRLLIFQCKHCNAEFFFEETLTISSAINLLFSLCCGDDKVKL